jgi:hypothetical protein
MSVSRSELKRPSIFATVFWALGLVTVGSAIYLTIIKPGWTDDFQDFPVILTALRSGMAAIGMGALIDMHTLGYNKNEARIVP